MSSGKRKITRSRLGCHRCKRLKVKCPEQKPECELCVKAGAKCDYTLKLTWGGRPFKDALRSAKALLTVHSYAAELDRSRMQKSRSAETPIRTEHHPILIQRLDSWGTPSLPSALAHEPFTCGKDKWPETSMVIREDAVGGETLVLKPDAPAEATGERLTVGITSPVFSDTYSDCHSDSLSFELDKFLTDRGSDGGHSPKPFPFHMDSLGDLVPARNPSHWSEQLPLPEYVSIPPSILPEPEILANVPYYKELFHFWINVAAENLVPAPSLYKDNPFKKLLPQMAMHYPGLLTTILAFAARAKAGLTNQHENHEAIVDHLLKRSCMELIGMLKDKSKSTSDGTLATSLLLSCYEVCHCNDLENHRTHTLGAAQIFVERSKKAITFIDSLTMNDDIPDSESQGSYRSCLKEVKRSEDDVTFFLARWFSYVDVVGALSSTRNRHNYLRSFRKNQNHTPMDSLPDLGSGNPDADRRIDFLLGFDEKLLPHMVEISFLIDEVEKYMQSEGVDPTCLPQRITAAALLLKDRFEKDCEAAEAKRESKIDHLLELEELVSAPKTSRGIRKKDLVRLVEENNILRSTNRLYSNMALLNLYRRVLLLPRESHLIQELIDEMTEILRVCIEPGSPGDICTIFPIFCAGCDTLDAEKKNFYLKRLHHLAQGGNLGADRGISIMRRCWATGEDWYTAANMMGVDLVLM